MSIFSVQNGHVLGWNSFLRRYMVYKKTTEYYSIWNPVPLDRIRQNGTYWYVPVRTGTTRYKSVREFHGCTYRYVPVHTGTYFQQDRLFSDPPRKSQER